MLWEFYGMLIIWKVTICGWGVCKLYLPGLQASQGNLGPNTTFYRWEITARTLHSPITDNNNKASSVKKIWLPNIIYLINSIYKQGKEEIRVVKKKKERMFQTKILTCLSIIIVPWFKTQVIQQMALQHPHTRKWKKKKNQSKWSRT